jgi:hypothetical protein
MHIVCFTVGTVGLVAIYVVRGVRAVCGVRCAVYGARCTVCGGHTGLQEAASARSQTGQGGKRGDGS